MYEFKQIQNWFWSQKEDIEADCLSNEYDPVNSVTQMILIMLVEVELRIHAKEAPVSSFCFYLE